MASYAGIFTAIVDNG